MKTPGPNQRRALALRALERVNRNPAALLAMARGVMAAPEGEGRLLIYGPIGEAEEGGVTAARVASELATIKANRLEVFINSPGGDVFEGLAIHAQLRRFAAGGREVVVHVDGLAASAASFVAMAGTRVLTAASAMWMVHRASAATFAAGNAGDMHQHADDARELAGLLEKIDRDIAEIYAQRSGASADEWLELMSAESWFTASEALERGLTDEFEAFGDHEQQQPRPAGGAGQEDGSSLVASNPRHLRASERPTTQHQDQGIFMSAANSQTMQQQLSTRASEIADLAIPPDASSDDGRRYWAAVRDALEHGRPLPRFDDTTPIRKSTPATVASKTREYDNAFKSQADFMGSVRAAALGAVDPRLSLRNAASTFGQEGVNTDGGFAVPSEMHREILGHVEGDDSLLALVTRVKTSSNRLDVPVDGLAPHNETEGIKATWEAEGAAINPSKPKLGALSITLNRLSTLVPLSDELLEDGVGLASWLPRKVGELFTARINEAIVRGSGVGRPLGLLESPALVTIAKETSQGNTIELQNILKMFAAMPAASQKRMVWIVTPMALLQLGNLVLTDGGSPGLFWPQGVLGAPGNTLLGRPIIVSEAASPVGTTGDIIAWDPTQYLVAEKVSGVRADTSIHCYFDQHLTAFRFSVRLGGQCTWLAPVSRAAGGTMSPVVTLATRG